MNPNWNSGQFLTICLVNRLDNRYTLAKWLLKHYPLVAGSVFRRTSWFRTSASVRLFASLLKCVKQDTLHCEYIVYTNTRTRTHTHRGRSKAVPHYRSSAVSHIRRRSGATKRQTLHPFMGLLRWLFYPEWHTAAIKIEFSSEIDAR